jgi:hypothetical protein
MFRTALVAVVALVSFAGCARLGWFGSRDSSPYLATKLCGVHIDGKTKTAHFRVVLTALKPLPANSTLEVEFQNPADDATTLTVTRRLTGNERTIEVLSPPLKALRPASYRVAARMYAIANGTQVIATHTLTCESLVDTRDLLP